VTIAYCFRGYALLGLGETTTQATAHHHRPLRATTAISTKLYLVRYVTFPSTMFATALHSS